MPANVNDTLYQALIQMGYSPEDARFRLHDILVEEVSVVDRAANKRRFLMVKSAGTAGAKMDNDPTKPNEATKLALSKGTKESLLGVLEKSLKDLVEVTTLVKNATEDAADEAIPTEITTGLQVAAETVRGSLAKFGHPAGLSESAIALRALSDKAYELSKADKLDSKLVAELTKGTLVFAAGLAKNQVLAQSLQEIAEVAMILAQMASEMEDGAELPDDMRAAMEQLAVKLTELTGGGGDDDDEVEMAKAVTSVTDVSAMLSEIGKAGAKMSASRRKQLRSAMETMQAGFESLMALLADVEPAEPKKSDPEPTKKSDPDPKPDQKSSELTAAMARITELEAKITKLAERPNVPASVPEPSEKPTTTKPGNSSGQGGPWIL